MMYGVVRTLWRFALRLYFRSIEVEGRANVPTDGPVLLVSNHTNAFVDAILLVSLLERRVTLTAKSTLRANPMLAALIAALGVILLRRAEDAGEGGAKPERNEAAIEQCAAALSAGEALCIFPEGMSHSDGTIRPFRTGAARIAMKTLGEGLSELPIVPVGLYFEAKDRLRSDVLVRFGKPVVLSESSSAFEARDLTALLEQRVREITLNFESRREELLIDWTAELVATRAAAPLALDRARTKVLSRVEQIEELQRAWQKLREASPSEVAAIIGEIRELRRDLKRRALEPDEVFLPLGPAQAAFFVLREGEILVFGLPIVLVGAAIHGLPWIVTRTITRMTSKDRDHWATNAVFFGTAIWLAFLAGELAAVWLLAGPWWSLLGALVAPFTAMYGVLWLDRAGAAIRRIRSFAALALSGSGRRELQARVATLIARIEELVERTRRGDADD